MATKKTQLPYSWAARGPNTWKITVSHGLKPNGTRRRHYTTIHAASEPEMHIRAAAYAHDVIHAKPAPSGGSLTLSQWSAIWMRDHVERELELSTQQSYRQILRNRIIPGLGHVPLNKLTPQHIARWLEQLDEEEQRLDRRKGTTRLAGETRRRMLNVLSSCLKEAVYRFYIPSNPCKATRPPKVKKTQPTYYQNTDLKWILGALDESPVYWRAWILLALSAGLRCGELIALEWSDIDWTKSTVDITRATVSATGVKGQLKGPKSSSGNRVLPIPPIALEALAAWKTAQAEHRHYMLYKIKPSRRMWRDEGDHIVTTTGGRWMTPNALSHAWTKWVNDNELPKVTLHGLRHTAASVLIAAGISARTVSGVLGHSQTSTTMNIYAHLIHDSVAAAGVAMNDALSRDGDKIPRTRD
jgi:integrase